MDHCADLPAIEARLAEYRLPAGVDAPEPLRDDLRECLDGEPGRRETLVDRARRCLAQDPLDADAARTTTPVSGRCSARGDDLVRRAGGCEVVVEATLGAR